MNSLGVSQCNLQLGLEGERLCRSVAQKSPADRSTRVWLPILVEVGELFALDADHPVAGLAIDVDTTLSLPWPPTCLGIRNIIDLAQHPHGKIFKLLPVERRLKELRYRAHLLP